MSFILKALHKSEAEKAARQAVPAEISSALLTPAPRSFFTPRRLLTWLIIPLAFGAGIAATYYYLPKAAPPSRHPREVAAPRAPSVQPSQPLPQSDKPVRDRVKAPATPSTGTEPTPPRRQARAPKSTQTPPPGKGAPTRQPELSGALSASTAPLTVSGIALQDDPAASAAVVNGTLVKRGMIIGGALVEAIYLDKVRFRGSSGSFEVHLAK
jgi:cytoskeletal protein RodZ